MDIHSIESNVKFPDMSFYNMEKPGEYEAFNQRT